MSENNEKKKNLPLKFGDMAKPLFYEQKDSNNNVIESVKHKITDEFRRRKLGAGARLGFPIIIDLYKIKLNPMEQDFFAKALEILQEEGVIIVITREDNNVADIELTEKGKNSIY